MTALITPHEHEIHRLRAPQWRPAPIGAVMNIQSATQKQTSLLAGAVMLVLVAILTLIGLAGLILPIVPGVLFLAMAAWLLAQIADRFAQRLHQSPRWQQASRTWQAQASLSARQRTKFWAWVALGGMVQAMTSLLGMVRRARFSR